MFIYIRYLLYAPFFLHTHHDAIFSLRKKNERERERERNNFISIQYFDVIGTTICRFRFQKKSKIYNLYFAEGKVKRIANGRISPGRNVKRVRKGDKI